MSYPVLVALAMLGGAYAASAVGMLTARQARASGVALGICGLAVLPPPLRRTGTGSRLGCRWWRPGLCSSLSPRRVPPTAMAAPS